MITRTNAIQAHRNLTRVGHLEAAHLVLQGIQQRVIELRAGPADFEAEYALEAVGATFAVMGDGHAVLCRVKEEAST